MAGKIFFQNVHILLGALKRHGNHRLDVATGPASGGDFGTHTVVNRIGLTVANTKPRCLFFSDLTLRQSHKCQQENNGKRGIVAHGGKQFGKKVLNSL